MKTVNKQGLAEIFGVTVVTVAAWCRRGCPYEKKGRRGDEWLFDTAKVAEWRERQVIEAATGDTASQSIDELRRRKLAAEASLAEIDLENRRGELIDAADALRQMESLVMLVRARLLAMPNRLAPVLATITNPGVVCEKIRVEVYAALNEMSGDAFQEKISAHVHGERKRAVKGVRHDIPSAKRAGPKRARKPATMHRTKVTGRSVA